MKHVKQEVRYGRGCPICGKPVELRLINYAAPFRCQNCDAMLDIASFYTWLTHALSTTVALVVLWKVFHWGFWFAAVGAVVLSVPMDGLIRGMTKSVVPLEPSDVVS